ncbi:MAG: FAD-dependent oxidoreductase [Planctomycetota bacterium]
MTDTDVLILGGGLAGLTTAIGLRRSGLRVTIVERDRILGGRARSWIDPVTGDPVHIGPHILLTEYPNFLSLLSLLGTRSKVVWQPRERFITMVKGRRKIVMKQAPLPPPLPFVPSVFADPTIPSLDKVSNFPLTSLVMTMDEADFLRLDALDARTFLEQQGVTRNYIDKFWAFTSMSIMNVPLEVCSAGSLMRFYRRLIGHPGFKVGFPDGGLGDLFAPGSRSLIEKAGGKFVMETTVTELLKHEGRVTGARLSTGEEVRARFVVSTLPPQDLARLVEWPALSVFKPCPYVSPYLWFDRKLTRHQFWARTYAKDDLNCDFYDFSNIYSRYPDRSFIGSNIIYSERAHALSDEEIVRRTLRELSEFLPGTKSAKLLHWAVNRIPMAIHCPSPGTERARPTSSPVPGLLLAGDWIQTRLPSSMESAVFSGWRTAETILDAVGRPEKLAIEHEQPGGFFKLFQRASRWVPRWALSPV